jgi:RNA polymerase-binding transcription factor DksA
MAWIKMEILNSSYSKSGLDPDFEEQAVQLENAEVQDALLNQALSELEEIEQKLRRRGK